MATAGSSSRKDRSKLAVALCLFFLGLPCFSPSLYAMQRYFSFDQIIQRADLIFLGKVLQQQTRYGTQGSMIFTDVYFSVEEVIYQRETPYRFAGNRIRLTFAGGRMKEEIIYVSDVPSLQTGERYLLFTRMDGKSYASPIIGAYQGLFRIIQDETTTTLYPLAKGERCILKVVGGELVLGPPVVRVQEGMIEKRTPTTPIRFHDEPPRSVDGKGARVSQMVGWSQSIPERIISLKEFIQEIKKRTPR